MKVTKMRTKEDLQKEFDFNNKALKLKEAPFWMLYSQFLEQKLIDQPQEREQREVSAEEYIHSKYWFKGGYIGIDENSLFQLMEEYADLKTLPYIVDKNVKLFNELKDQSQEPKGMDIFEINSLPELSADKKMEVCMNCTEMFDINHIGCICPTCFCDADNNTLDAEVFMNGCNIIPDGSDEDGHDAWTKESVLMLMKLFHKAQEPKQRDEVELHKCKWCNVMTTQSDDVCYANPSNRPKQREVSEKEYIPSDAFADELSVWKEKDYALKTSSMKEREAVEFAEWCVINANPIFPNKGQWKDKLGFEFTTQELFDLFKQFINNKI